jgi:hypothetical protein
MRVFAFFSCRQSAMDGVVDLFLHHFSPNLLFDYRHGMSNIFQLLINTLCGDMFFKSQRQLSTYPHHIDGQPLEGLLRELFVTGSNTEGASLARLFYLEDSSAWETELDAMIAYAIMSSDGVDYPSHQAVNKDSAFMRLKMDVSEALDDSLKSLTVQRDDGVYLSSWAFKSRLQSELEMCPELFSRFGVHRPKVEKVFDPTSASVAIFIDFGEEQKGESDVGAAGGGVAGSSGGERERRVCEVFKKELNDYVVEASRALRRLEMLQDE